MRIFVTGATGFVGSAVVRELLQAGHSVSGLTRSEAGARTLAEAGAEPFPGALEDTEALARGADAADAVIHTAFHHDFNNFAASCEVEHRAIAVLGGALEGSDRPLVVTSGLGLAAEGLATEADPAWPSSPAYPRASEEAAAAVAARGVKTGVVRLPPSVHDAGDHQFVPYLMDLARRTGVSAHVGDGSNEWAAVHRPDAARVFRLAIEAGAVGGPWHAVAEERLPFRDIAEAIGRRVGVPTRSLSPDEAPAHFGWMAGFAAANLRASSARTRERLGWTPQGPGLIRDIETVYPA